MTRVVEARAGRLDEALAREADVLVLFYGSNCSHSVRFLPRFLEAARGQDVPFVLVDVDDAGDAAIDVRARHDVDVTPTLVRYRDGEEYHRRDGRPGEGLSGVDVQAILAGIPRAPHS